MEMKQEERERREATLAVTFDQKCEQWTTKSKHEEQGTNITKMSNSGGRGEPGGSAAKDLPAVKETQETWVRSLGWEGLLEEGMATHSSILAWRIPWTEEPGGLQSMALQRVRHI